jgi:hypothetical protein
MADVMVAERIQHSGPRLRQAPHATVYQCAGHDLSSTHGFRTGPERLSVRLLHSKPHLFTAECWTLSRLAATILPRANHPPTSRQHPPEIRQSQQGAEENRENASDQRERLVAIVIFIMTSPPPARPWHGGRAKEKRQTRFTRGSDATLTIPRPALWSGRVRASHEQTTTGRA